MTPYYSDDLVTLYLGDCLDVLRELPDSSVDSVVTDPPGGISFMGRDWDTDHGGRDHFVEWLRLRLAECYRVMKPGAHALVWAMPRTSGWTQRAIEDAGLVPRDCIVHLFGTGFPKSLDVSKAIDRAAGAEREVTGLERTPWKGSGGAITGVHGESYRPTGDDGYVTKPITAPATPEAQQWAGWGTALKPASEHWWLARKPLGGPTVAANVTRWGTGALNIDASRIAGDVPTTTRGANQFGVINDDGWQPSQSGQKIVPHAAGRWPANVVLDESQAEALDQMSGERASSGLYDANGERADTGASGATDFPKPGRPGSMFNDTGGASRFFYTAKASTDERITYTKPGGGNGRVTGLGGKVRQCNVCDTRAIESGAGEPSCGHADYRWADPTTERPNTVSHPTVKPLSLMRWLVRLVTPPGGLILEPFAGSGTTVEAAILEGSRCLAIEREADYLPLITQRIHRRRDPIAYLTEGGHDLGLFGNEGGAA